MSFFCDPIPLVTHAGLRVQWTSIVLQSTQWMITLGATIALPILPFDPIHAAEVIPKATIETATEAITAVNPDPHPTPLQAETGMVVSAHPLASDAGVHILRAGGNAIDAAIATALAIAVVEPYSAGLGGGGFLLIYDAETREIQSLDFRERAPIAATADMYLDANGEPTNASRNGHRAVAVPGTVAGLHAAHQRYGQLSWSEVVQPAIGLAEAGFEVSERFVQSLGWRAAVLSKNPAARAVFGLGSEPESAPESVPESIPESTYAIGDRFRQPDLAATLRRLADDPEDFYHGQTATAIVADMAANGGLITQADLDHYVPIWRDPICGWFQPHRTNPDSRSEITPGSVPGNAPGSTPEIDPEIDPQTVQVCAMAPPSSGGVHLLQMLELLEPLELGYQSPIQQQHLLIEAMKIAYADRAQYLGDPDFVTVPIAALTSPTYLDQRRVEITPDRARSAEEIQAADPALLDRLTTESQDTSHLSVVDGDRNAASLTFTINGGFGAGVVAAGTGIVLNNEMDDFSIAPGVPNLYGLVGGEANAIAARKTPLSSMTPTIVTDIDANLQLVVGAPGGSTIITTVLQILLHSLVYDRDIASAIAAPRVHHQWQPDLLRLEADSNPAIANALQNLGHALVIGGYWGNANAIEVIPFDRDQDHSQGQSSYLEGAADPRGEGQARGF